MNTNNSSLSNLAYQDIKDKIIEMKYPPGYILSEVMLAESLGISRMPVRTALQRLAEEGWLDTSSPRKIKVKQITVADVNEVYDLRELIECSALRRIFEEKKTWDYSFELEGIILKMRAYPDDPLKNEIYDAAFHARIVSILNNNRINKIFQSAREEIVRMGMLNHNASLGNEHNIEQLTEIIAAMREENFEKTSQLHLEHLRGGRQNTIETLNLEHLG